MAPPEIHSAIHREAARVGPAAALVDDMLARYVDWRQAVGIVGAAWARWREAPGDEEAFRFSAYLAALDQEEAAATAYAGALGDVRRWLWRDSRRRGG
jgi:hypothetical protein